MRYHALTIDEVLVAQRAWADAVVAQDIEGLLALYDFHSDNGPLLFNPTMATEIRTDRGGTRSYFVGGDDRYPTDTGFLHKGWRRVRFQSAAGPVFEGGGLAANDMGYYVFTDRDGAEASANYTFSYHKIDGRVLITLHHSSFVYEPPAVLTAPLRERAVVLIAHGSPKPEWRRPLDDLAAALGGPAVGISLAFMAHCGPSLDDIAVGSAAAGVTHLGVLPLFISSGGHVSRELRDQVEAVDVAHPGLTVTMLPALGELDGVRAALATFLARHINRS
jgi:hypothetical protein